MHAKMLLIDDSRLVIGSLNLSKASLLENRELSLESDHDNKRLKPSAVRPRVSDQPSRAQARIELNLWRSRDLA